MLIKDDETSRWQLVKDLLAFQFKLTLDALRDLFLSPISIAAVVIGVISRRNDPGKHFYQLLRLGHKTDLWINLFGLGRDKTGDDLPSSDLYVDKVEGIVVEQLRKGGILNRGKNKEQKVAAGESASSKENKTPE